MIWVRWFGVCWEALIIKYEFGKRGGRGRIGGEFGGGLGLGGYRGEVGIKDFGYLDLFRVRGFEFWF